MARYHVTFTERKPNLKGGFTLEFRIVSCADSSLDVRYDLRINGTSDQMKPYDERCAKVGKLGITVQAEDGGSEPDSTWKLAVVQKALDTAAPIPK